MEMQGCGGCFEKHCHSARRWARSVALVAVAFAILFAPRTSYALGRRRSRPLTIEEYRQLRFGTAGSIDLTNEIGPVSLDDTSFSLSGTDESGREHDVSLSGHSLGVSQLVFDTTALSLRIGITDHFSLGLPVAFGGAPMSEPFGPTNDPNAAHVNGSGAFLFGFGISPGYEVDFGDSAIRFDAALLGRAIFLPTTWTTVDKHGRTVAASAISFQPAFEPRITVLPYAKGGLGLGFFGEMDAAHPDDWACGVVLQARWGKSG